MTTILPRSGGKGGNQLIPFAVSGVVAKLNSILSAFTVGLAQGCTPILSFNMGAKNDSRIKETYKKVITVATKGPVPTRWMYPAGTGPYAFILFFD